MDTITVNGIEYVSKDIIGTMAPISTDEPPYGGVMLVQTVTAFYVGEIVSVHQQEIVMRDACWVADAGRYHQFLRGEHDSNVELEPLPDGNVIIGRGSIVLAVPYSRKLRDVK